jgi:hypothetical protein
MTNAYIVTGTLTDRTTLKLDEALPLAEGKVRLTIEPLDEGKVRLTAEPVQTEKPTLQKVMEGIWARQAARGHVPRSPEEIEAQIREERESWGD